MCSGLHTRGVSVLGITIVPLGADRPRGIMEVGSQYWARSPQPVQAKAPNVQTLRHWGSCLRGPWRRRFEKLHGNLLSLLEVETQPVALEALAQYYD
ncbi:hypothetical protein CR513_30196, partial [Mucuna pruriens]